MVSKQANLEALLYAAGDNGLEEQNLIELLKMDEKELTVIINKLQKKPIN